jgi:hypothetical protein
MGFARTKQTSGCSIISTTGWRRGHREDGRKSPGEQSKQLKYKPGSSLARKPSILRRQSILTTWREEEDEEIANAQRLRELWQWLMVWKMPRFYLTKDEVDELVNRQRAVRR